MRFGWATELRKRYIYANMEMEEMPEVEYDKRLVEGNMTHPISGSLYFVTDQL